MRLRAYGGWLMKGCDFEQMSERELKRVIDEAPHLLWWDTINMAVHLAKMAQWELDRRKKKDIMLPVCTLKNGITLSVQASRVCGCTPQSDIGPWTMVEVGYPSERIEALMPFAEDPASPTQTTYEYVPAQIILKIVDAAGGLKEGLLPDLLVDGHTHIRWARLVE